MAKKEAPEILTVAGREVTVTNPSKPYFSKEAKVTKLEIVRYFLSVADGALRGIVDRPIVLKRFVDGAHGPPFYQKRAPDPRPDWIRTVTLFFPSGNTADEVVVDDAAGLAWIVNLGCMELHPHAVRSANLEHPDELRVDLDPGPGVPWSDVRKVALEVKALLEEMGLVGWPKTSGSRGIHINARIEPRWPFTQVRRAALALAREIERRAPALATSKWWKEERHGVFLDYNQNAKDRTTCSGYSVRPLPDARVSAPLTWDEVPDCEAADFTVFTVPARFAKIGDPHEKMNDAVGSLDKLLELAARDEASGLKDAPWPPNYRKMDGEAPRVAPSRARSNKPAAASKGASKGASKSDAASTNEGDSNAAKNEGDTKSDGAGDSGAAKSEDGGDGASKSAGAKRATRTSKMPLLTIANSPDKEAALAGLERWRAKYPEAAKLLTVEDVLVDTMRGRSSAWTRIRVNLRHVPEAERPPQETPDPDDDPTRAWREAGGGAAPAGASKPRAAKPRAPKKDAAKTEAGGDEG